VGRLCRAGWRALSPWGGCVGDAAVRCVFCAVIFPTSGCALLSTGLRSGHRHALTLPPVVPVKRSCAPRRCFARPGAMDGGVAGVAQPRQQRPPRQVHQFGPGGTTDRQAQGRSSIVFHDANVRVLKDCSNRTLATHGPLLGSATSPPTNLWAIRREWLRGARSDTNPTHIHHRRLLRTAPHYFDNIRRCLC
jgi:hypothetical protein